MGFVAWLTTRPESVTLGHHNDCAIAAEIVDAFITANELPLISHDYYLHLKHPSH